MIRQVRIWLARRLWPRDFHPEADFYRCIRDLWIAQASDATTDEERLDAYSDAMDSLYSYFLAHDLIHEDTDAQVARFSGYTEDEVRAMKP